MVELACEWCKSDHCPLYVFVGDIYKAYDTTTHDRVVKALRQKKIPRILIAAWLREWRRCSSVFSAGSSIQSQPITRNRSLLQGDPSAPTIFNATLDAAAAEFLEVAKENSIACKMRADELREVHAVRSVRARLEEEARATHGFHAWAKMARDEV